MTTGNIDSQSVETTLSKLNIDELIAATGGVWYIRVDTAYTLAACIVNIGIRHIKERSGASVVCNRIQWCGLLSL